LRFDIIEFLTDVTQRPRGHAHVGQNSENWEEIFRKVESGAQDFQAKVINSKLTLSDTVLA